VFFSFVVIGEPAVVTGKDVELVEKDFAECIVVTEYGSFGFQRAKKKNLPVEMTDVLFAGRKIIVQGDKPDYKIGYPEMDIF
jgi:hypothetical protein